MSDSTPNIIIEVTTHKDGVSATDRRGKKYKIESVMLGAGGRRMAIKYSPKFLSVNAKYNAEILPNGKLNIL